MCALVCPHGWMCVCVWVCVHVVKGENESRRLAKQQKENNTTAVTRTVVVLLSVRGRQANLG